MSTRMYRVCRRQTRRTLHRNGFSTVSKFLVLSGSFANENIFAKNINSRTRETVRRRRRQRDTVNSTVKQQQSYKLSLKRNSGFFFLCFLEPELST